MESKKGRLRENVTGLLLSAKFPRVTGPISRILTRFPFLPRAATILWRALAVLHFVLLVGVLTPMTLARTDSKRDVVIYYETAQKVAAGKPLYIARPLYGPDKKPFDFLYPPPFAAAIAPIALLDFVSFARVWTLVLLASWLAFSAILVSLAGAKLDFWNVVSAVFMVGLVHGSHQAFSIGQLDPLLWLLFVIGIWSFRAQKARGGVVFALAALAKIYSVWSLFALRGKLARNSWIFAGATLICGFVLGALVCGLDSYAAWFKNIPSIVGQGTFDGDNFSLSMLPLRAALFVGWNYQGGPLPAVAKGWLTFATALGPISALAFSRRLEDHERAAVVGAVAALCAPICWSSYLPLLLVPGALLWKRNRTG